MRVQIRLTLASFVLLALVACGTSDASSPDVADAPDIEVTVDIFSGVPNPTWTVSGSEAATLASLIKALPEVGAADASAGLNLGFRGFVLRGLAFSGAPDQARVLGAELIISRGDTAGTGYTDKDRAIYTMLRTMAQEHLDKNVFEAIPADGVKRS